LVIVACAAISLAAPTAQACSMAVPPRLGETQNEAYERAYRSAQDQYWIEADTIFIGEVESLRRNGDRVEVEVSPRGSLKGDAGHSLIRYTFDGGSDFACGFASFPNVASFGVFYARQEGNRIAVQNMLLPAMIKDQALQDRVMEQAEQVRDGAMQSPSPEAPAVGWVPAAAIAALSLIVGLFAGRVWGARSMRKRKSGDV
jgi:hypothetical protein